MRAWKCAETNPPTKQGKYEIRPHPFSFTVPGWFAGSFWIIDGRRGKGAVAFHLKGDWRKRSE
jgi:hypothetical protein